MPSRSTDLIDKWQDFLFMAKLYIYICVCVYICTHVTSLSIHLSMDAYVVSMSELLSIMLQWTWVHRYLFEQWISFPFNICLEVELLDDMVILFLIFEESSYSLPREGNGTPLQYSCLEDPMDGGAWWAAVHGVEKSRTRLSNFTFTFHFSLSCIGEGSGNPLQCSCLENPRDGGAWWAAVYGVAQSWTQLKQLSSSSNSSILSSIETALIYISRPY